MFGKTKTGAAVVEAKPPMLAGSAAMMLKGMGIDPVQVEGVATDLIGAVQNVENRLSAIERQNAEILALLKGRDDTAAE